MEVHPSFTITKKIHIDELQCDLIELTHTATGAHVLHLANDDPENVFCLALRTTPDTSNGVAHILEHVVLCGSKRYPVRDPFFLMQRRSLNTFMNALTGADFTCYPAASQVKKDFYNLLEVYFDAVFHPLITLYSFRQEGWRYEFKDREDKTSLLEYKGIVFNEMKGALSNPTSRLIETLNSYLYPDITYGVNSGGDPVDIPKLTYEELKAFHATYYHPSRCLFFFYGNLPLNPHLDFLDKRLQDFSKEPSLAPIPRQTRFKTPKRIAAAYPLTSDEEMDSKAMLGMGWLTCHVLEQEEVLALQILTTVLMDTDASPLKMALLRSGLCKHALVFLDTEATEVPVVIILKGCETKDAEALEETLRSSLKQIMAHGVPKHLVESALHQMEFYRSEISGGGYPFGLSLFLRAGLLLQHQGKAEDALSIHTLFDHLRAKVQHNPRYYEDLIERYFLGNQHFVRVVMTPDADLSKKEEEQERKSLEEVSTALSDKQREEIVFDSEQLVQMQEQEDNVDLLPEVTLDDVPLRCRSYALNYLPDTPFDFHHHPTFTNGIVYTDLSYDLPFVAEEDLSYVRLFASLVSQVACGGRSYIDHLERVQAHTGGIGVSLTLNLKAHNHRLFNPSIEFRAKSLQRHAEPMLEILYEILTSPNFQDKIRLKEIIDKQYTAMESSLNTKALKYAMNLANSGIDAPGKIARLWYGIDYYKILKDLSVNFDKKADWIIAKLEAMKDLLLRNNHGDFVLTCDKETGEKIIHSRGSHLAQIQGEKKAPWNPLWDVEEVPSSGYVIASPVAFTAMAFETVSYAHPDSSALTVASAIMDNSILHKRIREQGGAYGGGASQNNLSGKFSFYAYRDPNLSSTVKAFHESLETILKGDFDQQEIEEAQLEIIQGIDAPDSPGSRGDIAYGWDKEGLTQAVRQEYRNRLLCLSKKQVQQAVEQHLVRQIHGATLVSFASQEFLEKENKKLAEDGNLQMKQILTI